MTNPPPTRATLIEAMACSVYAVRNPGDPWPPSEDWLQDDYRGFATAALDALLAALPGLGLRVVPVEASDAMLKAAAREQEQHAIGGCASDEAIWDIMIAAAPDVLGVADE